MARRVPKACKGDAWNFAHGPHPHIQAFAKTLRKGLRGLSYIGMIEPALCVNIARASVRCRGTCTRSAGAKIESRCGGGLLV
jgi:hypothetical protein